MWDGRRYDRTGQPGAAVPHRLILTCRADETSGRLFTCPLGRKTRAGNRAVDSEGLYERHGPIRSQQLLADARGGRREALGKALELNRTNLALWARAQIGLRLATPEAQSRLNIYWGRKQAG
jgi:hypothetical protein